MAIHEKTASFDVVVIGGGFSGVCAAIAAAREGVKVAIIQNRSVFGGTGSSETRMHIVGANCHSSKPNLRETGIIEEILLENKRRNPYADFPIFDMIIWEKVKMEENITAFLNTNIEDIVTEDGRIRTNEFMETDVPGVYAAGDIRTTPLRQVITACADGAVAATRALEYCSERG